MSVFVWFVLWKRNDLCRVSGDADGTWCGMLLANQDTELTQDHRWNVVAGNVRKSYIHTLSLRILPLFAFDGQVTVAEPAFPSFTSSAAAPPPSPRVKAAVSGRTAALPRAAGPALPGHSRPRPRSPRLLALGCWREEGGESREKDRRMTESQQENSGISQQNPSHSTRTRLARTGTNTKERKQIA